MADYDALAAHFELVYPDWEAAIARQADQLDGLIRELAPGARTVLDCACGVGTQALGLAAKGYEVTGSDLSAAAVARAEEEARRRGASLSLSVRDMREVEGEYDVVLAADNSVTHLLTDDDLRTAFRAFRRCARRLCLVTVRDYAAMELGGTQFHPYPIHVRDGVRYSLFQMWEFRGDSKVYDFALYIVEDRGGATCATYVMRSSYYTVSTDRLRELMREAGFARVERIDGRFFQPVLVGFST